MTEAGFLVHLLDTGISEFPDPFAFGPAVHSCWMVRLTIPSRAVSLQGHVIDCPQVLSTGSTILLNVKVYLARAAFEKVEKDGRGEQGSFWQEQKETGEEEAMRKRKDALGLLFGALSTPLVLPVMY